MNKIFLTAALAGTMLFVNAQQVQKSKNWCLANDKHLKMMATDAQYAKNQQILEAEFQANETAFIANQNNGSQNKSASVVRIIPVVFHVIHYGGAERIDRSQILNQLSILNADFRRLNTDTTNTPGPFKPLSADCEIEFRLAQKDPFGNCTDGITYTYSSLTYNARDNVKALIDWPNNKYLNIWIVSSIENTNGTPGTVIGFAQFPGGNAATDGVVVVSSFTGDIGTAAGTSGRPMVHEIGHWLNLRHIWGDDGGTCAGTDYVTDTPNQADMNFSTCPSFPVHDACQPSGNGVMFTNYMDYTDGNCQNQFSAGQSVRMNTTLSSNVSQRNNLWSSANLIATGTDGTPPVTCTPIAEFLPSQRRICAGTTLAFEDWTTNGPVTSTLWQFPGGVPSSSTSPNPVITYPNPGVYDVTLTSTNSAGSNTITHTQVVRVDYDFGLTSVPYSEGFETINFPGDFETVNNGGSSTWDINSSVAATGSKSVWVYNYGNNPDETTFDLITPDFKFTYLTNPTFSFKVAFAPTVSTSTDNLRVFVSYDCGRSWVQKYNKSGLQLGTTGGVVTSNFTPTAAQWRTENVPALGQLNNKNSVRFKFVYSQINQGNNIYIDDININGTVGLNDFELTDGYAVLMPNPAQDVSTLSFTLNQKGDVTVRVLDVLGKEVERKDFGMLTTGNYSHTVGEQLNSGIYFVELIINNKHAVRKLIIE